MHAELTIFSILLLLPGWINGLSDFTSPCPDVFKYDNINTRYRKWYGTLYLFAARKPTAVTSIRILLDNSASDLNLYNHKWQGRIESFDKTEFVVRDPNVIVKPGVKVPLRFFVISPAVGPIPQLIAIRVNEVTVCSGTSSLGLDGEYVPRPQKEQISTTSEPVQVWNRWPFDGTSINPFNPSHTQECGTTVANVVPLIVNGESSVRGQWPWHGALYIGETKGISYRCGMTLITTRHVLTAAHCITTSQHSTKIIELDSVLLYFGKTKLSRWHSPDMQEAQPAKLTIHPHYNCSNLHNDIAVIHLVEPVRVTNWVRPICLGKSNELIPILDMVNKKGTVVGWGFTQRGDISDKLQHANIPVIEPLTCLYSDPVFYSQYSSPKSFCAGIPGTTSACNGDSGGGLVFRSEDTNVWHIRGVVSLSSVDSRTGMCDVSHYAVFTDVALFLDWINEQIGR